MARILEPVLIRSRTRQQTKITIKDRARLLLSFPVSLNFVLCTAFIPLPERLSENKRESAKDNPGRY